VKKIWSRIRAMFCRHPNKNHHLHNIITEDGFTITVGWEDCRDCGYSKINFFYGN
jgi:hypothetical protein